MRIAGLIAVAALAAGCSHSVGGRAESPESTVPLPGTSTTPATTAPATPPAAKAPARTASIDDVIGWVEAGTPADASSYHVAFRDGVTTQLAGASAFTAPSGAPNATTQCVTDPAVDDGALTCLLDLTAPPPRPADAEGMWKAGWIDFSGAEVRIGALRGDPGPFVNGPGPELSPGQSLAFGDTRCRSDAAGLFCVNYAHRSAIRISADGVVPFGCLLPATPPPGTGARFSC